MKRLAIILALLLVSLGASAQISSVAKKKAIQQICSFRSGWCTLNYSDGAYFITLKSTNRFDDPFILYIGDGDEQARKTLEDLIALHKELKKGDSAQFNTLGHTTTHPYEVYKADRWAFHFIDERYAGTIAISVGEMEDLRDKFVFQ